MIRPLAVALAAAIAFVALGHYVTHHPAPAIDLAGRALAGHGTRLALFFTESCWWEVLLALGIGGILVAVRYPAWRGRVVFWLATMLVTWQASDALKIVFRRPRPDYWVLIHEPTYAYPSGHAMFALVVYSLWAWFIWDGELPEPVRATVASLLALWACGVLWSRLALGAHYVTDLIGGLLLGVTALALASAVAAWLRERRRASAAIPPA